MKLFLLMLSLVLYQAAQAQDVEVNSADPASAEQGTINLDVTIGGNGFDSSAEVHFVLTGTNDPAGISVNSTKVRGPKKIIANIDIADTAVIDEFDIQVRMSRGRGGKGTTLFRVLEKGSTSNNYGLVRVDFWSQGTSESYGIFDDGQTGFLCGSDWFDYVDLEDSDVDCTPDPWAQTGTHSSKAGNGGLWALRLAEQSPGDNPRTVTFDFSGYENAADCQLLNAELAEMGLDCGCADPNLVPTCNVHLWVNADNMFKSGAERESFSRMDIYEITGTDGQDGVDLRIYYHEDPYICEAAGHEGDEDWRVIQTAPCWSNDLDSGALADVVNPNTGGPGNDDLIGQWLLPLRITGHRVPVPPDGGEPPPVCTDADGDGVCVEDGDCDDNDPDVYPGHSDRGKRWGRDGIDNDCDGTPDR